VIRAVGRPRLVRRDIAERLVQGRERVYLQHMIEVRIFDPSAIAPEDFDAYVRACEAPGAMRAAFELYRAFDEDGAMLQDSLRKGGKLKMPVLTVGVRVVVSARP
jgi:hypothetical protein